MVCITGYHIPLLVNNPEIQKVVVQTTKGTTSYCLLPEILTIIGACLFFVCANILVKQTTRNIIIGAYLYF